MPVNEGISLVTAWASTVEPSRPLLWRSLAEWYADVLHSAAFSFGKLANARLLGAAQEISSCLLIQPADFALNGPTLIWSGQRAHPVSTCRGKGFAPGLLGVYSDAIMTRTFSQPCLVWTRFHDAGPLHSAQVPQCGASTTCFRSTFRCWTALPICVVCFWSQYCTLLSPGCSVKSGIAGNQPAGRCSISLRAGKRQRWRWWKSWRQKMRKTKIENIL